MPPTASPAQPDPTPAPAGTSLRGVAGGYDITRWPIAVPPELGEHPASWLWRVAHRYGMTPSATLTALGLRPVAASPPRIEQHLRAHAGVLTAHLGGQHPFTDQVHNLPQAQGLEAELLRYTATYRIGRLPGSSFRFCPRCLAESTGTWPRWWFTRLPAICPTHHANLLRVCPGCGTKPFASTAWLATTTPSWVCPHICGEQPRPRRRRTRCGQDLRKAPAEPPEPGDATTLAALQDLATAAATGPEDRVVVAGVTTTTRDHLDAVFELIDEMVGIDAALAAEQRSGQGLLASAQVALSVLTQADAHQAAAQADRHGLLDPAGRHTPLVTDSRLRRRLHNPLLAAIRLRSLGTSLSPTAQLTFRTASTVPRYPAPYPNKSVKDYPTAWPDQTRLEWVPQVIWPGTLTPWVDDADIPARAAASMLLAKVGSTRPWSLIALDLGLPAAFAITPPALVKSLRRTGCWEDFLSAVDDLATRLEDDPPPIDYSARRWAAADQQRLSRAIQTGKADFRDEAPARPDIEDRLLTALVWQTYTGGDARFHTDLVSTRLAEVLPDTSVDTVAVERLVQHAATVLHNHPDAGPLQWRPP